MVSDSNKPAEGKVSPTESNLRKLYELQVINSEIDKIHELSGALPLQVKDLEDEIIGLNTRIDKYKKDIKEAKKSISEHANSKSHSSGQIEKYKEQLKEVRNNKEYNAIQKEVEYEELEIELMDKKIKESEKRISDAEVEIEKVDAIKKDKEEDLDHKKQELDNIIDENKKDEQKLEDRRDKVASEIDERYRNAFYRIRNSMRNGLAVVTFHLDACGGCFNRIPPQRQLDIASRRRVIVCEHCGRILVDTQLAEEVQDKVLKR